MLRSMTWDELVTTIAARHPTVTQGRMFGMPCLKRADGKVVASLWGDGGITVKLVNEKARHEALALQGAKPGSHAFDPGRPMRQWIRIPASQAPEWQRMVESSLS
jgi:hypothetical protein